MTSLRALCRQARPEVLPPARTVELPCCYGGELGFDLEAVAGQVGLSPEEVARLHASADYYVYFVGFTPGLPYMTGMSERLNIPRLVQPRVKTPPGSVSIGGVQCCIYSVESPGGFYDKATAKRLHDTIMSVGNTIEAGEAFRRFRGRDVTIDALMRDRGFPAPARTTSA